MGPGHYLDCLWMQWQCAGGINVSILEILEIHLANLTEVM